MKGGAKDLRLTQALSSSCGPLNSTLWFCHVVNFEFTGWIKLHKITIMINIWFFVIFLIV